MVLLAQRIYIQSVIALIQRRAVSGRRCKSFHPRPVHGDETEDDDVNELLITNQVDDKFVVPGRLVVSGVFLVVRPRAHNDFATRAFSDSHNRLKAPEE